MVLVATQRVKTAMLDSSKILQGTRGALIVQQVGHQKKVVRNAKLVELVLLVVNVKIAQ